MGKLIDLTGLKFGKLRVERREGSNARKEPTWRCSCKCGGVVIVKTYNLTSHKTKSCGCIPTGPKRKEKYPIGSVLNYITIVEKKWCKKNRCTIYGYHCKCGRHRTTWGGRINKIISCGCHVLEARKTGFGEISGTYWNAIKCGARDRQLSFDIDIQYAWSLYQHQHGICSLSGLKLSLWKGKKRTASLDRIDSTRGYVVGNVQWVHKRINNMKQALSQKEFVEWCRLVTEQAEKEKRGS